MYSFTLIYFVVAFGLRSIMITWFWSCNGVIGM